LWQRAVPFAVLAPDGQYGNFLDRPFYTWTSDVKTQKQIDHVLIDKRWHSNIVDVQSFRGADSDTDHYLVDRNVRQRLSVSKQATQKFYIERFNLRKLNDVEVKEQYQV
jgi:hypothetical protein